MDFTPCRRGQRPEGHRSPAPEGLVRRRLRPLLKFVRAPFFEALAIEVDREMISKPPIENSITEVLKGIETTAT